MSRRVAMIAGLIGLSFAVGLVTPSFAATIRVPANAPTIQIAIEKAQPLDTIVVDPGTYSEVINFGGKVITVRSTNPSDPNVVAATVINAGGLGSVVTFTGGEDHNNSILDGFTITGGTIGIEGHSSRAIIRHCVVRDNSNSGIYQADGLIEDCHILNNNYVGLNDCDGTIRRCIIDSNRGAGLSECDGTIIDSTVERSVGAGVSGGSIDIIRCTIASNQNGGTLYQTGDIEQSFIIGNNSYGVDGGGGLVRNSVVAGNRGSGIAAAKNVLNCTVASNGGYGFQGHTGTIRHCIIWDNQLGPIVSSTTPLFSGTANPYFFQAGSWDELNRAWINYNYHLQPNSPYINAGDPNYPSDPNAVTQDIEGSPRVVGSRVDIGAYEFGGACEGSDFDGDETPDVCDPDIDNDGVPNFLDVCDYTPAGIAVDDTGRPLADANKDCIVDLRDFAILQNTMFGP